MAGEQKDREGAAESRPHLREEKAGRARPGLAAPGRDQLCRDAGMRISETICSGKLFNFGRGAQLRLAARGSQKNTGW